VNEQTIYCLFQDNNSYIKHLMRAIINRYHSTRSNYTEFHTPQTVQYTLSKQNYVIYQTPHEGQSSTGTLVQQIQLRRVSYPTGNLPCHRIVNHKSYTSDKQSLTSTIRLRRVSYHAYYLVIYCIFWPTRHTVILCTFTFLCQAP
jgi:hypothetical protein